MTLVATSGWNCNGCLFVYRYDADADKWESGWENTESFHFLNKMRFKGELDKVRKVNRVDGIVYENKAQRAENNK